MDTKIDAKIVIVGVGALGSHLVPLLRNEEAVVRIVDFDRVERKNVMSQFHAVTGVGKAKVVALSQLMQFLFGLKVETIPNRLTADNVVQILGSAQLVIDCLDNAASRRVVQDFVRARKIPCLHGALAAGGGFGRVVWDDLFVIDSEDGVGAATCENGEHLPYISVVASYLAYAAQQFLRSKRQMNFNICPTGAVSF